MFVPEILLHILHTFKLINTGHYIHDEAKSIPIQFFCSFWKISKLNFTDIFRNSMLSWQNYHNSISSGLYCVLKLSVLQWYRLAILACSNYRCLKISRRTGWKINNCLEFIVKENVASKFIRIEPWANETNKWNPVKIPCLGNCPTSITNPIKTEDGSRTQENAAGNSL